MFDYKQMKVPHGFSALSCPCRMFLSSVVRGEGTHDSGMRSVYSSITFMPAASPVTGLTIKKQPEPKSEPNINDEKEETVGVKADCWVPESHFKTTKSIFSTQPSWIFKSFWIHFGQSQSISCGLRERLSWQHHTITRNVLESGSQLRKGLTFLALGEGRSIAGWWCKKVPRSLCA